MATASNLKATSIIAMVYGSIGIGVALTIEALVLPYDVYFYFKIAIIPTLVIWVIWQHQWPKWLLLALFFSWIGDILIHQAGNYFFLAGVGSFLLAHIMYTLGFVSVRQKPTRPKWFTFLGISIYLGVLLSNLLPHAGDMWIPILLYSLVISTMFLAAVNVSPFSGKTWLVAGAVLFIVSDSVLAFNRFAHAMAGAGYIIMGTYMLAQWCLVYGGLQLTRNK